MSRYRKQQNLRVAYGFSGQIQEEMEVFQGFQEVAKAEDWQLLVLHEQFETQLRGLLDRKAVDAVVGGFMSANWLTSLPANLALIHRGADVLSPYIFSVGPDLAEGIRQAKRHFVEMGYLETVSFSPQRMEGLRWLRSLESLRDFLLHSSGAGVFCASDYWARQAIYLAKSLTLAVPEDFGFVGVGDRRLDRLLSEMEISSLPLPHREIGRVAGALLLERLGGAAPRQILIRPGRLIPRMSSRKHANAVSLKSRVEEILANRLADPPPVEDWARSLGMSRRSFENAFSAENGITPYVYLMQLRTEEARRLLRETDWTIARIGQTVGIPDPPRFSAFFKKTTGQTASEWRG